MKAKLYRFASWILVGLSLFVAGGLLGAKQRDGIKAALAGFTAKDATDVVRDDLGRLIRHPQKTAVPCPAQDDSTAVLLLIGQSNAANDQGQRHDGASANVINFADGKCYLAASPLLGTEGEFGESWTLLANKLLASKRFEKVVLVPAAVGSTEIARWAEGGDVNRALLRTVESAMSQYKFTHILWHQGETDFRLNTPEEAYAQSFRSLLNSLRAKGVLAPIYVSVASYEQRYKNWVKDNPISAAQKAVVNGSDILAGPDTDALVGAMDRYDGTHFSATGQEKFTDEWLRVLK
jgi:hypothetical protein